MGPGVPPNTSVGNHHRKKTCIPNEVLRGTLGDIQPTILFLVYIYTLALHVHMSSSGWCMVWEDGSSYVSIFIVKGLKDNLHIYCLLERDRERKRDHA